MRRWLIVPLLLACSIALPSCGYHVRNPIASNSVCGKDAKTVTLTRGSVSNGEKARLSLQTVRGSQGAVVLTGKVASGQELTKIQVEMKVKNGTETRTYEQDLPPNSIISQTYSAQLFGQQPSKAQPITKVTLCLQETSSS